MKSDNVVQKKSFEFAILIVNTYKDMVNIQKEYVLSKQLLRSGTSIGANIEEAIGSHTEKEFLMKFGIAYKEARESLYWIKLLHATGYLTAQSAQLLIHDSEELCRIIGSIQTTMKSKLSK
jgi:four helix bundle protein